MIANKKLPITKKNQSDIKSSPKLFVIASEGTKTEPDYFKILKRIVNNSSVNIKQLTSNTKSSPLYLLKRIKDYIEKEGLDEQNEAWIVLDRDQWKKVDILEVIKWSLRNKNYGLALTNPKFEYWLLLHFEEGNGVQTAQECSDRLKKYLLDYEKSLSIKSFNLLKVKKAVSFLEKKPQLSNEELLNECGTTVHILVERIIGSKQ